QARHQSMVPAGRNSDRPKMATLEATPKVSLNRDMTRFSLFCVGDREWRYQAARRAAGVRADTDALRSGFTALGALGIWAETVDAEAAEELCLHLASGAALDPHLVDQLVPYLAMCCGESTFTTSCIIRHLLANLWVTALFLPFSHQLEGGEGQAGRVTISPHNRTLLLPGRPGVAQPVRDGS